MKNIEELLEYSNLTEVTSKYSSELRRKKNYKIVKINLSEDFKEKILQCK